MKLFLKKNEERRLFSGHLWAFSNEVERTEGTAENGDVVEIYSHTEKFIGKGFYNKNSLIAYRHLTSENEVIDKNFILKRILEANYQRTSLKPESTSYRVVNSESDFLPGLIIDRFGERFSVQTFSCGADRLINEIVEILSDEFGAKFIVEKNDNSLRTLEGLTRGQNILLDKTESEDKSFEITIDGIKFKIDLLKGQKTGFYLDQVENRFTLRKFIKEDSDVLDLFCNEGGFALNAAYAGAKTVTGVDSSEHAVSTAKINSSLNSFTNTEFISADVFDYIKKIEPGNKKYDIVILDPPSFTKSKKNINTAFKGYVELNSKAMTLIKNGGYLFTYSCSHHIDDKSFNDILIKSSYDSKRKVKIIDFRNCSYDHPVLPQMPETRYLKSYILKIL